MNRLLSGITTALSAVFAFTGAFEYGRELEAVRDVSIPNHAVSGAYAPLVPWASISSSVTRPYSMGELFAHRLSFSVPVKPLGFSADWSSFGTEGYKENTVKAYSGLSIGVFSLGLGGSWYGLKISGGELDIKKNFFDASASMLVFPFSWLEAGAAVENIKAFFKENFYIKQHWGAGINLKPFQGLSLRYNFEKDAFGFTNTIAVTAHILPFCSLSCGYARETMTWTGSLTILFRHVSAEYTMRQHPYLGTTHIVAISLRSSAPYLPAIKYGAAPSEDFEKVDINACSDEELAAIPMLTELQAERLIAYRSQIGALTEKALKQMGLSSKEITGLQAYAYGLAEDKREQKEPKQTKSFKKNQYAQKAAAKKAAKSMFMLLVESGLSPAAAMDLSEAAAKGGQKGFKEKLDSMSIDEKTKRLAEEICKKYQ